MTPGQAACALTAEELGAVVNAAQAYDYEHRPRGEYWARVSDRQAGRIVLGALAAVATAQDAQAAPGLAALRDMLDEATRTMLNLGTRPAEINLAHRLRKQAGLAP